ncbi:hypothetical protein BCR33DRAFT_234719 [Rhizoclosmatium globosum]|uniref:Cyclic nucleotide-binding domain-containing protein n=1 Tax=Rhizoclosmatium globosum TaxID=329046 RepID=A0A1Y2CAL8_9FUNG|nr:hypothetical protein BCR33DRAFT_234719 [Rhizoclosmatium globosum]|eukprot:ORY44079.1 hypothetical protein BCR33DRAFT_234719 [Rhizoclosmatium globosum]
MSTPLSSSSSGSGLSSPASNGLGVVLESDMHAQTITVTVSWAVIGLVVLGSVVVVAVVYRVVVATRYSRLPFVSPLPNSADAPTPFDLRLDSHSDHAPPIDDDDDNVDILRKVKALGFLDRQVVNELGRHLVTRKVRAGHAIIAPEDSASNQDLYVVLDGTVGVFVKGVPNATPFLNPHLNPSSNAYYTSGFSSGDSDSDLGFSSTDEDRSDLDDLNVKRPLHSKVNLSGFHLLNQVKKNATVVSSLSSILQVVTEGINLPQPLQSSHHSEANTPTIEIIPMPEPNPSSASFASTNSNSTSRASNSIPIPLPHSTASSSSDLLSSTPTSAATGSFFQQPRAPISPPRTSSLYYLLPQPSKASKTNNGNNSNHRHQTPHSPR